jgi:hypothetical protein
MTDAADDALIAEEGRLAARATPRGEPPPDWCNPSGIAARTARLEAVAVLTGATALDALAPGVDTRQRGDQTRWQPCTKTCASISGATRVAWRTLGQAAGSAIAALVWADPIGCVPNSLRRSRRCHDLPEGDEVGREGSEKNWR